MLNTNNDMNWILIYTQQGSLYYHLVISAWPLALRFHIGSSVETSWKFFDKKRKAKEPQVQVVESDDDNLSPDTSKVAKKKKKVKTFDAISP